MKSDREIAYEQNVTGLEKAWAGRIETKAQDALRSYKQADFDPSYDGRHDHITDVVTSYLLDSERWENVEATDISDIAYEAASRALDAFARDTAATQSMVADMERDGLL